MNRRGRSNTQRTAPQIVRSGRELGFIGTCALAAAAASWIVFASLPASRVMVGTHTIDSVVPLHYQASVFPAFGAYCGALALDLVAGDRSIWLGRVVLVVAVVGLVVVRLTGHIGLSGHAVGCAALGMESMAGRRRSESGVVLALAAMGLAVTGWYKLGIWGDPGWFLLSVATGAAVGYGCGVGLAKRSA